MNVIYPFPFTIEYRKEAGAPISTKTQIGYLTADVPVVTDGDVVELATWIEERTFSKERVMRSCVRWNGDLYVEVLDNTGDTLDHLPEPSNMHTRMPSYDFTKRMMGDGRLTELEISAWQKAHLTVAAVTARSVSGIETTNMARNSDIVRKCLEGLLVVDGTVWMKAPDVSIKLQAAPWSNGKFAEIDRGVFGFDSVKGSELSSTYGLSVRHFGLTESARMREHAGGGDIAYRYSSLRTASDPALSYESEGRFTSRAVEHLLEKTSEDVGGMEPGRVADWLYLREAFDAWSSQGSPFPEGTADAICRVASRLKNGHLYHQYEEVVEILQVYGSEHAPSQALEIAPKTRRPA